MNWKGMDGHRAVKVFYFRQEAEFAAQRLRDAGIPCEVFGDDGGGSLPLLQTTQGIAVYVHADQFDAALALLEGVDEA